jgi:acyl-coenzyme A thioesterase PaaI-like protein
MTTTIDSVLRDGLVGHGDDFRLTLDPAFQGLPDTAHGGTVLAAFHAAAGGAGRRALHGSYRRRVPLGVPLPLTLARDEEGVSCRLVDDTGAVLVDGGVHAVTAPPSPSRPPVERGDPLPISSTCFACGVDNPLGLRARLFTDDVRVMGRWEPRESAAMADGLLAPIALTALLDEAAFWLGALATGEAGMTTELAVTLHEPVPFGPPIVVAGSRDTTRQRADDARYWDTEVAAFDDSGQPVATGHITFVAVRGAARRLVAGLLKANPADVLARVFPAYGR